MAHHRRRKATGEKEKEGGREGRSQVRLEGQEEVEGGTEGGEDNMGARCQGVGKRQPKKHESKTPALARKAGSSPRFGESADAAQPVELGVGMRQRFWRACEVNRPGCWAHGGQVKATSGRRENQGLVTLSLGSSYRQENGLLALVSG